MNDKLKTIAEYWNNASVDFDERHATEDLALWSEELEKAIGLNGKGRILDVGTGTGFLALLLAKLGYEVVGLDFAEKMLEIGREKARKLGLDVSFVQGTCEHLPFASNGFDAVVNCRVMWTLTEPVKAVEEWKRVLKPGGKVISFMRMMNVGTSASSYYGDGIELPLRCADRDDYVRVYHGAGLDAIQVSEMPEEMSHAEDMPGWTMFTGIK